MEISKLTENEISLSKETLSKWAFSENSLKREFKFTDFKEAFAFMTQVALIAESMNHHPNWQNMFNLVIVELSTHDLGGLTMLDLQLAKEIDSIASK